MSITSRRIHKETLTAVGTGLMINYPTNLFLLFVFIDLLQWDNTVAIGTTITGTTITGIIITGIITVTTITTGITITGTIIHMPIMVLGTTIIQALVMV